MMKLKHWLEVVEKGKPVYPIVEKFIKEEYGQKGSYNSKSGNNEQEHCVFFWAKKDLEKNYNCNRLWCHEMLLHIAASFGVPDKDLEYLYHKAKKYVCENGRELKKVSVIANETMKLIEETEKYNQYRN